MPCSCDGMEQDHVRRIEDRLEREHLMRCRAQSLAHKLALLLARNSIDIPPALRQRIAEERASLLEHKRAENDKDVKKATDALDRIQQRAFRIRQLGGLVSRELQAEIDAAGLVVEEVHLTDEQLMGVPE